MASPTGRATAAFRRAASSTWHPSSPTTSRTCSGSRASATPAGAPWSRRRRECRDHGHEFEPARHRGAPGPGRCGRLRGSLAALDPGRADDPLPDRRALFAAARALAHGADPNVSAIGGAVVEGFEFNSATHRYRVACAWVPRRASRKWTRSSSTPDSDRRLAHPRSSRCTSATPRAHP